MDRRVYDNYVFQVAEQGSLTKAAISLGISQPALSLGLNSLEKEVGFKIFNRRSIPVSFTSEGMIYYDYIRRLRVLDDDFQIRLAEMRKEANRQLVIGGPSAYIESIVTDAVIELNNREPNFKIRIKCSSLSELVEMASEGKINCFISTSDNLPNNFELKFIRNELLYMVIPKENPVNELIINQIDMIDYSVISGQHFIFLEEDQPLQKRINAFISENRINALNNITVDQVSTAVNLSAKGAGISIASEEALEGNINLENVCIYPLPSAVSERKIYVAYDRELYMSNACKKLIELLVKDNSK